MSNINQIYQQNLKKFVLANPDYKNRGNIDEKKNKIEFNKLGSTLEGLVQLLQHQHPINRENTESKIEVIMANIDAFFRYAMVDQLRFNQKDREEIREQMEKIKDSLNLLSQVSPSYSQRVKAHLKTLDELNSLSGGVRYKQSDQGIYDSGASVNDDDYIPSLAFRINNQMNLRRNPNYLPSKFSFNEPETL